MNSRFVLDILITPHVTDILQTALASNWRSYKDSEGNTLRVRPHWAKEFPREVGLGRCYERCKL